MWVDMKNYRVPERYFPTINYGTNTSNLLLDNTLTLNSFTNHLNIQNLYKGGRRTRKPPLLR